MASTISVLAIPEDYKYVLAVVAASSLTSFWHGLETAKARKRANVPYPNCYATAAEAASDIEKYKFNCAQRAHANYVEQWIITIPLLAVAGLKYPVYSAVAGGVWLAGRIMYAIGYQDTTKKEGKGRYKGIFYAFGQIPLLGMAGYTLFNMIA